MGDISFQKKAKSSSVWNIRKRTEVGYTLIELLVVIIITGVLSAIALPSFLNQAGKARGSEAKSILGSVNRAQQAYRFEKGSFASDMNELQDSIKLASIGQHYNYTVSGAQNTARASAEPVKINFKVYDSGIAMGTDERFAQVICESVGVKGSVSDAAIAQPLSGTSPSATCADGNIVR